MQVIAKGLPCTAHIADDLALLHILSSGHGNGAHVGVAGGEGLVVPDEHVVAPGPVVLGGDDLSRLGRHDGGAVAGADIQAVVGTVEVHIPKVAGNAPHPHAGQGPNGRKAACRPGVTGSTPVPPEGCVAPSPPSEPPFWACWFCNACWRFSSSCRLRSAMRASSWACSSASSASLAAICSWAWACWPSRLATKRSFSS